MESLIPEGIRQVAQQGTGWLLLTFMTAALVWLYRKTNKDRDQWESERAALQEKRIAEARDTVGSLNAGTAANVKMAQALEEQAAARHSLMQLVTQMERDMDRNNEAWKPEVAEIKRLLNEILAEVRRRPS